MSRVSHNKGLAGFFNSLIPQQQGSAASERREYKRSLYQELAGLYASELPTLMTRIHRNGRIDLSEADQQKWQKDLDAQPTTETDSQPKQESNEFGELIKGTAAIVRDIWFAYTAQVIKNKAFCLFPLPVQPREEQLNNNIQAGVNTALSFITTFITSIPVVYARSNPGVHLNADTFFAIAQNTYSLLKEFMAVSISGLSLINKFCNEAAENILRIDTTNNELYMDREQLKADPQFKDLTHRLSHCPKGNEGEAAVGCPAHLVQFPYTDPQTGKTETLDLTQILLKHFVGLLEHYRDDLAFTT